MVKGRLDNGMGQIEVKPDVIATYAGSVAVECFGIVGMAAISVKDGLVKILKGEPEQGHLGSYYTGEQASAVVPSDCRLRCKYPDCGGQPDRERQI